MNTQIEEKNRQKAVPRKVKNGDPAIFPGKKYFIILITTVILLLSLTVSFFAVLAMDASSNDDNSDFGGQSSRYADRREAVFPPLLPLIPHLIRNFRTLPSMLWVMENLPPVYDEEKVKQWSDKYNAL